MHIIPARQNSFYFAFAVSPSWDQLAVPPAAPFAGPDDTLSPLQWMSTHLHYCRTMQGALQFGSYRPITIEWLPGCLWMLTPAPTECFPSQRLPQGPGKEDTLPLTPSHSLSP